MKIPFALGLACAALSAAGTARADTVEACARAAEEGQSLRDKGQLVEARARFVSCSAEACPRLVRTDCGGWLADVEARTPTMVLAATGEGGRDLTDVTVTIDGAPAEPISARAIPLDPGPHRLRFARPSGAVVDRPVVLREGERRRVVTATFGDTRHPLPLGGSGRPTIIASIALGGAALAGAGLFAGLATAAKDEVTRLRSTCAPDCTAAQVDAVRAKEIGANVALGVGIAAAAAAVVVLVVRPGAARAASITPAGLTLRF